MNTLAALAAAIALAGPVRPDAPAFPAFRGGYEPEVQYQVHIEERVIIRLAPSSPSARRRMFDGPPRRQKPVRYKEKKLGRCVDLDDIAGIAPAENRLLFFMRDHQLLSVALERVCNPDAFYLGASVERNADGRLCSGRDTLRARTGVNCQIARINRLVAIKD